MEGETPACEVDRSWPYLHSSLAPHVRTIDALDRGLRSGARRVPAELRPYRYNVDPLPATTPAFLASIPETGGFIAVDRARRRPRRIGHPTRAEFPGSTGELRPCCWSAHPSPEGGFSTSLTHSTLHNRHQGEFPIKPNFSCFYGDIDDEEYLLWEQEVDKFLSYSNASQEKQVRYVASKLKGRAGAWWEYLIRARRHEGRSEVRNWGKMKRLLRAQFLPVEYEFYSDCLQQVNANEDLVLNRNMKLDYGGKLDNYESNVVGREQFKKRTNWDSVNLREDKTIEMNLFRSDDERSIELPALPTEGWFLSCEAKRGPMNFVNGCGDDQRLETDVADAEEEEEIGEVDSNSSVSTCAKLEVIDERYDGSSSSSCFEEGDKCIERSQHIEPINSAHTVSVISVFKPGLLDIAVPSLSAKRVEGVDDSQVADPVYDSSPSEKSASHISSLEALFSNNVKSKERFQEVFATLKACEQGATPGARGFKFDKKNMPHVSYDYIEELESDPENVVDEVKGPNEGNANLREVSCRRFDVSSSFLPSQKSNFDYALDLHQIDLDYFIKMRSSGVEIVEIMIVSIPNGSTMAGIICLGRSIQAFYVKSGRVKRDVCVGSVLIDMYAKCDYNFDARRAFDEMHFRNVVSWTSLISGYVHCNRFKEALSIFCSMLVEGPNPNEPILSSVLIACAHLGALEHGRWVHSYMNMTGIGLNSIVGSALIDTYAKCGEIGNALSIFHRLPNKVVYSWTTLINGLAVHGPGLECLHLFSQMLHQMTCASSLLACSGMQALREGQQIHGRLENSDLLLDLHVEGAFMDMYSKCGMIDDASPLVWMILSLLSSSLLNFEVMPRTYGVSKLSELKFPPKPGWWIPLLQDFELESSSF